MSAALFVTRDGRVVEARPRGKHYVKPWGYAAAPGTGPEGKTCRDCAHYTHKGTGRRSFPACGLMRLAWTSGRATDILAGSPACKKFEAQP